MDFLYELRDITLLPTEKNRGHINGEDYSVIDQADGTRSFPIFTSPMDSIVGKESIKDYIDNGIRPIMPLTEPISLRLDYSKWIFCAFTMSEAKQYFLLQDKRNIGGQFHVCIDPGNGHDVELFELGKKLKQMYNDRLLLMGGNIGLPETYLAYSRAGFDYVRVGMSSGSLVNKLKYGFHYPMASLLLGIKNLKGSAAVGLPKHSKIVADGGIEQPSDIMKAIALGADYVMIGREFSRLVEAQGPVYKKTKESSGKYSWIEIDPDKIRGYSGIKAKNENLRRYYFSNTCEETRSKRLGFQNVEDWRKTGPSIKVLDAFYDKVDIDCNLPEWISDLQKCIYYGFMMTGSISWEDYKKNVRYAAMNRILDE